MKILTNKRYATFKILSPTIVAWSWKIHTSVSLKKSMKRDPRDFQVLNNWEAIGETDWSI